MKNKPQLAFIKDLRKNLTDAENVLWYHLRNRRLNDIKFRRQQQIGNYIVDFISFETHMVIEVDGGQHNEEPGIKRDRARTAWLEEHGFKVLRFWDNEVLNYAGDVVDRIMKELNEDTPSS